MLKVCPINAAMPKRVLEPVSHSADSHRAGGFASCSSADSHRADDVSPDTMVTVFGTFDHDTGIQIMLISEFGHMFEKMSNVEEIFTTMLA